MVLFRALVPTVIPLLFAIAAVITAFLLLYLAAAVSALQHDHRRSWCR